MSIPYNVQRAFISLFISFINIVVLIQSTLFIFGIYQYNPSKRRQWFSDLPKMRRVDLKKVTELYQNDNNDEFSVPESYQHIDLEDLSQEIDL